MQKNLVKISIIILVVIMILVTVIGTILFLMTDAFKSKDDLFKKYIFQNIEVLSNVLNFETENEYKQSLSQSDYLTTITGTLKYLENQNDEEEIYDLRGASLIKKSESKSYRKYMASYNNRTLMTVETLSDNEIYGFRLTNLVKQFVSIKNESLPYLLSSLGINGQNVSEKLEKVDFSDVFKFSEEEIQTLENTYMNAIFSGIEKGAYSSKSDAIITLKNGQSPSTKSYTLTLTQNDVDKVYKRILNQALEDQIILGKIGLLEEKIKEIGINIPEENGLKEGYISYLNQILDKMEYTGTDESKTIFTVYQLKGKTVRTDIKNDNTQISIELSSSNNNTKQENIENAIQSNNIDVKIENLTENGIETTNYSISKEVQNNEVKRLFSVNDNNLMNLILSFGAKKQDSTIQINNSIEYSTNNIARILLETEAEINPQSTQEIPVQFEEQNNILLNNYEEQQIAGVFSSLKNKIIESLTQNQDRLNVKLLGKIVDKIEERERALLEAEQNQQEQEIQTFNNQFELFGGKEIEYQYMQSLLEVISNNIKDYQIVDGNKIRVLIEEDQKNAEKMREIRSAITERYKYNVDLNYDENKRISSIDISMYREDTN